LKKAILLLIGLSPVLVGFLLNFLIMRLPMPMWFVGIIMLFIWFLAGKRSVELVEKRMEAVLLLNAPAFVVLLLLLFQEIVLERYWSSIIGIATQMFYLPFLGLSFFIGSVFHRIFYAYIFAFILLLPVSFYGRIKGERRF